MIYSCSDDYPYVYDFNNDFYYISPNAPKRLSMPRHCFRNVIDTFRSFVHPEDFEALQKAGVELCMECGCCSFVCPAKRPIVQNNKLAKADLREYKMKEKK